MDSLPSTPDWKKEVGFPKIFYLREQRGWRWYCSLDGDLIYFDDFYLTESDARKASIHWRITSILEVSQENQQTWGCVPLEHQPSDREIQDLSLFVWKVLSKKEVNHKKPMIDDLRRQLQLDKTNDSDETAQRIVATLASEVSLAELAEMLAAEASKQGCPEGARALEIAASNLP